MRNEKTAGEMYNLLIGTYTDNTESKGLYVYSYDAGTLTFVEKGCTKGVDNPSYLCVNSANTMVYCVNEDGPESTVTALCYSAREGSLLPLNKVGSAGDDPCYIINDDKNVIVANYGGGNIAVLGKEGDGSLSQVKQVVQHKGSSVDKERQEKAHTHMVHISPDRKYVFSADLGTDKIYIYAYNADGGATTLALRKTIDVIPGSGPRHLAFHPDRDFFAVINELGASIAMYRWDNENVELLQDVPLKNGNNDDMKSGGAIIFSPDGKFLYATNREQANTVTAFKVGDDGGIFSVQEISAQGQGPRSLCTDPAGNYILVANENSNAIVVFKRNRVTGMLTDTGKRIKICAPVCLVFTSAV